MKILYITHSYNEIDFLPYKVEWCKQNGLGMYVLDNFSNDGTWEYLNDNKIACERVNTRDTFHLAMLQKATDNAIHRIAPDWVVYVGMDTFISTPTTLREEIYKSHSDVIFGDWLNIFNTGEERDNPFKTYFYYAKIRTQIGLIYRYSPKARLFADQVNYGKISRKTQLNGVYFNMGNTKPAEQRRDTLQRRQKAWLKGLTRAWGTHYPVYNKLNWVWDKAKLHDIRGSNYYELYKKLWTL